VVHAAGDQWLRGPAPSDLKVIVVDIDRASIDALGTRPCRRRRWRGSSRRWRPGGTLTRPRHGNCSAIVGPGATASCDLTTFLRRVVSLASRSALHADRRIPDGHGARPVSRRRGCRGLHPKQTAEYGRPAWAEIHDCRQDPLSSSHRQMRQAKPAMLTVAEVGHARQLWIPIVNGTW